MQAVPIDATPNNNFDITLFVNGRNVTFNLFFSWNEPAQYWTMDIRDEKKIPIACNIPLLADRNLLEQLQHLKIGQAYFIRKTEELPANANTENINDYYLLWGDN